MRKVLRVTASVDGWYSLKVSCDEGTIVTNLKLEANKPLELSFVNDRPSLQIEGEEKPQRNGYKYNNKQNTHHRRHK